MVTLKKRGGSKGNKQGKQLKQTQRRRLRANRN